MATRRRFLIGLVVSGLLPTSGWADVGSPSYLSAARLPSGAHALFGLGQDGRILFKVDLPDRGHAAATHPSKPMAVAFARRPGRFAIVLDCLSGSTIARLSPPDGFHFYGHGVFSNDGALLFTTENDFDRAQGKVGLWSVNEGFRRVGAFNSGGVGPHDLRLMPDGQTLVVANGGIETHPASGRSKLNLPDMRPNLSYLGLDGTLLEQHEPPAAWHKASIRHLAVRADGLVAAACQWEGDLAEVPPLLALHHRGQPLAFCGLGQRLERDMQGYVGSVAFSGNGREVALTAPRGGLSVVAGSDGTFRHSVTEPDICGVASALKGFAFTTGVGHVLLENDAGQFEISSHHLNWDNHLVKVG